MESLAYIHLALAYEAPPRIASHPSSKSPKLFEKFNWKKLSSIAAMYLLSLTVSLGILSIANQAIATLQQGDRSPEVSDLQQRLQELGYFQHRVTGLFGRVTKTAVIRFQENHQLYPSGIVDAETESLLFGDQSSGQIAAEVYYPGSQNQEWRNPGNNKPILQKGDRYQEVRILEQKLANIGYYPGAIDDIFTTKTEQAIKRFQQQRKLSVNGMADPPTWKALYDPNYSPNKPLRQLRDRRAEVKLLQQRLQKLGYLTTNPDAIFGSNTRDAIRRFQLDNDLNPSGIATLETQQLIVKRLEQLVPPNQNLVPTKTFNSGNSQSQLQRGSQGEAVTRLQLALADLSFNPGKIDGRFGKATERALKQFQRSRFLNPNGIADLATLTELGLTDGI